MLRDRRRIPLLAAIAALALLVLALPLVFLTESGAEKGVKRQLGLYKGCVPRTAESPFWRLEPSLPQVRDEPGAVELGHYAYLAGGSRGIGDSQPSNIPGAYNVEIKSHDLFTRFDPRSGEYTELTPLPRPVNHDSVVTYKGDMYVVSAHGSRVGGWDPLDIFWRYSFADDRWTDMPALPTPRGATGTAVLGDQLLVAGGLTVNRNGGLPLKTLEIFDFRTGRWSKGPDMRFGREHFAAAVVDGKFYAVGGRAGADDAIEAAERYDPSTEKWETIDPMPVPAGSHEGLNVDGQLIVLGGGSDTEGTTTGAVRRYDPKSERWDMLPSMRTPRHSLGVAVVDGRVFAFGGSPCAKYSGTDLVESFDARAAMRAAAPKQ